MYELIKIKRPYNDFLLKCDHESSTSDPLNSRWNLTCNISRGSLTCNPNDPWPFAASHSPRHFINRSACNSSQRHAAVLPCWFHPRVCSSSAACVHVCDVLHCVLFWLLWRLLQRSREWWRNQAGQKSASDHHSHIRCGSGDCVVSGRRAEM